MKFTEYLIREKFLTAFKRPGFLRDDPKEYIEIYENPTESETQELIRDFKKANPECDSPLNTNFFRGMFDKKGNMFVWVGSTLHYDVIQHLKSEGKLKQEILHFTYERDNPKEIDFYKQRYMKAGLEFITKEQIMNRITTAFPKVKDIKYKVNTF
jgi:hypothetical protein